MTSASGSGSAPERTAIGSDAAASAFAIILAAKARNSATAASSAAAFVAVIGSVVIGLSCMSGSR